MTPRREMWSGTRVGMMEGLGLALLGYREVPAVDAEIVAH